MTNSAKLRPATVAALLSLILAPIARASVVCEPADKVDSTTAQTKSDIATAPSAAYINEGRWTVTITEENHKPGFAVLPDLTIKSSGAKFIVERNAETSTIALLSGSAVIKNKQDKSVVEIHAGTAYIASSIAGRGPAANARELCGEPMYPLFLTAKSSSFLALVNNKLGTTPDTKAKPQARVITPPTALRYQLGADAAHFVALSPMMREHYPPDGLAPTPLDRVATEQPNQ